MKVTLETLELTPKELACDREAIRRLAYLRWIDLGRPENAEVECWLAAEKEWIEHYYVPHRVGEEAPTPAPATVPTDLRCADTLAH